LSPCPAALLGLIALAWFLALTVGGFGTESPRGLVVAVALVAKLETGVSKSLLPTVLKALLGSHLVDAVDVLLTLWQTL
jgi:hypothetical protein